MCKEPILPDMLKLQGNKVVIRMFVVVDVNVDHTEDKRVRKLRTGLHELSIDYVVVKEASNY